VQRWVFIIKSYKKCKICNRVRYAWILEANGKLNRLIASKKQNIISRSVKSRNACDFEIKDGCVKRRNKRLIKSTRNRLRGDENIKFVQKLNSGPKLSI